MLGQKVAKHGDVQVIITLEIPENALTNLNRLSAVKKETAQYRTNKAKVLKIEDKAGNEQKDAESFMQTTKTLRQVVGEFVQEPAFDKNLEEIQAEGIHFFLSRRIAECGGAKWLENGLQEGQWDNGEKVIEVPLVNGKKEGLFVQQYLNGSGTGGKHIETPYVNDLQEGISKHQYRDGSKSGEYRYVKGEQDGLQRGWYDNGQIWWEAFQVKDNREGLLRCWHRNGTLSQQTHYAAGEKDGLDIEYFEHGQKRKECTYAKGLLHGPFMRWHENGQKHVEANYVSNEPVGLSREQDTKGICIRESNA